MRSLSCSATGTRTASSSTDLTARYHLHENRKASCGERESRMPSSVLSKLRGSPRRSTSASGSRTPRMERGSPPRRSGQQTCAPRPALQSQESSPSHTKLHPSLGEGGMFSPDFNQAVIEGVLLRVFDIPAPQHGLTYPVASHGGSHARDSG